MQTLTHIDTANQLNNSWQRDTVLGIYIEKSEVLYSIRISRKYKSEVCKILRDYWEKDIVLLLQSFLVFRCIESCENQLYRYESTGINNPLLTQDRSYNGDYQVSGIGIYKRCFFNSIQMKYLFKHLY